MSRSFLSRVRCMIGSHQRSSEDIRKVQLGYRRTYLSRCLHCGAPLERKSKGRWVVPRDLH